MSHDVSPLSQMIIVVCYFAFAAQLIRQAGRDMWRNPGNRAIAALVTVFLLCAISGYAADIINFGFAEGWLHWMLAGSAVWLVASNQAGYVAALMRERSTSRP